ncbi:hypothetical protein J6590_012980 [Homalodisca vitripennis]|nr:hypothetical protein J6590_012980 [Homalodisca vitripennis]
MCALLGRYGLGQWNESLHPNGTQRGAGMATLTSICRRSIVGYQSTAGATHISCEPCRKRFKLDCFTVTMLVCALNNYPNSASCILSLSLQSLKGESLHFKACYLAEGKKLTPQAYLMAIKIEEWRHPPRRGQSL